MHTALLNMPSAALGVQCWHWQGGNAHKQRRPGERRICRKRSSSSTSQVCTAFSGSTRLLPRVSGLAHVVVTSSANIDHVMMLGDSATTTSDTPGRHGVLGSGRARLHPGGPWRQTAGRPPAYPRGRPAPPRKIPQGNPAAAHTLKAPGYPLLLLQATQRGAQGVGLVQGIRDIGSCTEQGTLLGARHCQHTGVVLFHPLAKVWPGLGHTGP